MDGWKACETRTGARKKKEERGVGGVPLDTGDDGKENFSQRERILKGKLKQVA